MTRAANVFATLDLPAELCGWAAEGDLEVGEAWATCPRGDWLITIAVRARVDRIVVVRAAAACARLALPRLPDEEPRARKAIEAAESWLDGKVRSSECWATAFGAADVCHAYEQKDVHASAAAGAAAATAFACDTAADDAYWAERAYVVEAVMLAARAVAGAGVTEEEAHRLCAERVRTRISLEAVHAALPSVVRMSERPMPVSGNPNVQRASVMVPRVEGGPAVRIELQRLRR
jgi:hypothetical protein